MTMLCILLHLFQTPGSLLGSVLRQDQVLALQGKVEMVLEHRHSLIVARPVGVFVYDWKARRLNLELENGGRPIIAEWMAPVNEEIWIKDKLSGFTHRFSPESNWQAIGREENLAGVVQTPVGTAVVFEGGKQREHGLQLRQNRYSLDFGPRTSGLDHDLSGRQVLAWQGRHLWYLDPLESQLHVFSPKEDKSLVLDIVGDGLPRVGNNAADFLHEKTAFRAYMEKHPPLSWVYRLGNRVIVGYIPQPKTGLRTVHVYDKTGKAIHAFLPLGASPTDHWTVLGGTDQVLWCRKDKAPQRLFRFKLVKW